MRSFVRPEKRCESHNDSLNLWLYGPETALPEMPRCAIATMALPISTAVEYKDADATSSGTTKN